MNTLQLTILVFGIVLGTLAAGLEWKKSYTEASGFTCLWPLLALLILGATEFVSRVYGW